jgi:hypothetical protein
MCNFLHGVFIEVTNSYKFPGTNIVLCAIEGVVQPASIILHADNGHSIYRLLHTYERHISYGNEVQLFGVGGGAPPPRPMQGVWVVFFFFC